MALLGRNWDRRFGARKFTERSNSRAYAVLVRGRGGVEDATLSRQMAVRLSAMRAGRFILPRNICLHLVLISISD
jgi:hypothetical protein